MKKFALANLITILILSVAFPVNAQITTKSTVDDSLFITYDFEKLNQTVFEEAFTKFKPETIPEAIVKNLEKKNQTLVRYGFGAQPLEFDNDTKTIRTSFFLGGSDIISFTVNKTTLKRTYQVKTEWRKFQVNLTSSFPLDFAQHLAKPVAEWQKINYTDTQGIVHSAYYYENRQTGMLVMFFYIILPASASRIQVQGDTIFYDMPPYLEDQLLDSPFLILGVLAAALVIILIYRKAH